MDLSTSNSSTSTKTFVKSVPSGTLYSHQLDNSETNQTTATINNDDTADSSNLYDSAVDGSLTTFVSFSSKFIYFISEAYKIFDIVFFFLFY